MSFMRRSVRRRAGFNIDRVAPLDVVPESYVPTLFGHAREDTFIPMHHSERLFVAHGADVKNFVAFEGDHNSARPNYWYENAVTFLLGALEVEDAVLSSLDIRKDSPSKLPHMTGEGIYVGSHSMRQKRAEEENPVDESEVASKHDSGESDDESQCLGVPESHDLRAPWDSTRIHNSNTFLTEEEQLQQVLELSLEESKNALDPNQYEDEEEQLEQALKASLDDFASRAHKSEDLDNTKLSNTDNQREKHNGDGGDVLEKEKNISP